MLTGLLPLFPLPRLVLLPGLGTVLHIFEPRYRAMVSDCLVADASFILVRSRRESESDLVEAGASTFEIGTRVRITACETLPDGRFNLRVQGLEAVRILEEVEGRSYRQARWRPVAAEPETWTPEERRAFLHALQRFLEKSNLSLLLNNSNELASIENDWLPTLAAALDLPLPELQFLLEAGTLREMGRRMTSLLEFSAGGRWFRDA